MKYKEGIVQSIMPSYMAGTGEQGGTITIICPKCERKAHYEYAANKDKGIYPKYCAYCGEEFNEDEERK